MDSRERAMRIFGAVEKRQRMSSADLRIAQLTAPAARFTRIATTLDGILAPLRRAERRLRMFEAAGWLPHFTTPFDALDDLEDEADAGELLDAHYREAWPEVSEALTSHVESYAVDDEARAVFAEALDCHEAGAYRAVSRLVFPEIERLATAAFPEAGGKQGGPVVALRAYAAELYLDQTEPGGAVGGELFRRLDEHLYQSVHTPAEVERARLDQVPMRHAALHGRVPYNSFRNSLNALIMTDYVLQVISIRNLEPADDKRSDGA